MAVTKRLLAEDSGESQVLKLDSRKRYLSNPTDEWQILLSPNSTLANSTQILKIAAEFNQNTFNGIRLVAYLYNPEVGGVDAAATCVFNIYVVRSPNWQDIFVSSFNGNMTPNNYFFRSVLSSEISSIDLFGGDTIMVEAVVTRLSETYRNRIYVNHLGIFDNITRVRQDVEFIDITKLDE